jgi:hypothetical protein
MRFWFEFGFLLVVLYLLVTASIWHIEGTEKYKKAALLREIVEGR